MDPITPHASTIVRSEIAALYSWRKRLAIVVLCIVLSAPSVAISLLSAAALVSSVLSTDHATELQGMGFYVAILMTYAWIAFAVMATGWIRDRRVAKHWAILGTIAGIVCVLVWSAFSLTVLPSVFLAAYLVRYHVTSRPEPDSP
jgi:hypothetical protein